MNVSKHRAKVNKSHRYQSIILVCGITRKMLGDNNWILSREWSENKTQGVLAPATGPGRVPSCWSVIGYNTQLYKYNVTLPNQTFICKQPECAIKCADANVINDRKYFSTIKRFLKTCNVTACVRAALGASVVARAGEGWLSLFLITHHTLLVTTRHTWHVTRDSVGAWQIVLSGLQVETCQREVRGGIYNLAAVLLLIYIFSWKFVDIYLKLFLWQLNDGRGEKHKWWEWEHKLRRLRGNSRRYKWAGVGSS